MTGEAWVAVAGVLVSAVFALLSRRDADRAEKAAADTRGLAERQTVAQERMAAISEERLQSVSVTGALPVGSPDVAFELDYYDGDMWVLRNVGTKEATGVRIDDGPTISRGMPDGISLGPLRSHKFLMAGTMGSPLPHEVLVSADQLAEPVPLQVPPKPRRR
jgi:hypothetical protein